MKTFSESGVRLSQFDFSSDFERLTFDFPSRLSDFTTLRLFTTFRLCALPVAGEMRQNIPQMLRKSLKNTTNLAKYQENFISSRSWQAADDIIRQILLF